MFAAELNGTSIARSEAVNRAFGRRLRSLRRELDLSQAQLAGMLGVSRITIANIEGGKQNVQLHQAFAFASALDVQVSRLIPTQIELEQYGRTFDRVRSDLVADEDVAFLRVARAKLSALTWSFNENQTPD